MEVSFEIDLEGLLHKTGGPKFKSFKLVITLIFLNRMYLERFQ